MTSPSIAILGPGGVGGLLAAALARAGTDVTVIARESTAELIARDGIAVESVVLGDFTARPAAAAHLTEPVGAERMGAVREGRQQRRRGDGA